MPPRKKRVVKTVRKVVPKPKTSAPKETPPIAVEEAEPPIAATSGSTPADYAPVAAVETIVEEPEATKTLEEETAATKALEEEPAATKALEVEPAATKSLEEEPAKTTPDPSESAAPDETLASGTTEDPPESSAAAETLAEEPAAMETTEDHSESATTAETIMVDAVLPETAPDAGAIAKPAAKTTTRVKKIVKKKIIVKRIVPKACTSVEGTIKVEEKAVSLENPSSDTPITEAVVPKPCTAVVESIKVEEKAAETQHEPAADAVRGEGVVSDGRKRKKTEIFVGGLDRDAKEEDIKKVFGRAGEILEVRLMMEGKTGKNKGYAFVRYAEQSHAKKAVSEFTKVEVCGKLCGASALEGNDTIFLGSIDKKWKKEDIIKLLQENEIDKIDALTIMPDPNNAELNRGFAFLELETNRDAQLAFKKLQKKDAFGPGRLVKVAWAEPMNDPDEEEMQKVKSVYVEGIPSSWDESKVKVSFKRFGEIQRIVLARNIQSAKRKDFAFVNYETRESALSCIDFFDKEELTDNGLKVNVKVSLAKPVQKGKQSRGQKSGNKDIIKEKPITVQRNTKVDISLDKANAFKGGVTTNGGDAKSSTTRELLNVLREQASWKHDQTGYSRGPMMPDHAHAMYGAKRPFSAMGDDTLYPDPRGYPRARVESSYPLTSSSYGVPPHGMAGSSLSYYQPQGFGPPTGGLHGAFNHPSNLQGRPGGGPYGNNLYPRY